MRHERRTPTSYLVLLTALLIGACGGQTERFGSNVSAVYSFGNIARADGIRSDDSRTWGATWNDFDSDGDPDLFAGRHWREPGFFINRGNHFTDYARDAVFEQTADRHGCAWGEANSDGRPDLYCVQGADKGEGRGPNQLFIQTATGFVESAEELGAGRVWTRPDRELDRP